MVFVPLAAALFGMVAAGAAARLSESTPPPLPSCFETGSGYGSCQGMAIPGGSAIVKMTVENQKSSFELTGPAPLQFKKHVACGDLGCIYNHLDWTVAGPAIVRGCRTNTSTCEVKVAPGSSQWAIVMVRQNNDQATIWAIWNSGKKGGATISGYVRDKEKGGVSGVAVDAYATNGQGGRGVAVSGDQGFYTMEVEKGSYKVIPSGHLSGQKTPKFDPDSTEVTVAAGGTANADFTLQGGLQVTLTLSETTVKADGFAVVNGEVETTKYGKPLGGVTVSLRPKADVTPDAAVSSGALATICALPNGARIWPTGTLTAAVGSPVDVVTDAAGHYKFTITVGTTPGPFTLTAWARDASGQLITADTQDTSDDQTLTLSSPGNLPVGKLFTEIVTQAGDTKLPSALAAMTNDPASITQVLSQVSRTIPEFGGLAYSLVNGSAGGGAVLVYNDTSPPRVNSSGQISMGAGFVLSPGLWAGNAIRSFVTGTPLNVFIQKGQVNETPTFTQWLAGAPLKGWNLKPNTATPSSPSFEYNGWPYPATPADGGCN